MHKSKSRISFSIKKRYSSIPWLVLSLINKTNVTNNIKGQAYVTNILLRIDCIHSIQSLYSIPLASPRPPSVPSASPLRPPAKESHFITKKTSLGVSPSFPKKGTWGKRFPRSFPIPERGGERGCVPMEHWYIF